MMQQLVGAMHAWATTLLPAASESAGAELRHLIDHGFGDAAEVPARHPESLARHLPTMLAAPTAASDVAAALAGTWRLLDWHYSYPDRRELEERIAFAEVVGPAGPLLAQSIRAGFTFMAPEVLYPAHAHPARELYVVLSGRAHWRRRSVAEWQDPGDLILHAGDEPHAMRTESEPLLAMYVWSGEIMVPPRYV